MLPSDSEHGGLTPRPHFSPIIAMMVSSATEFGPIVNADGRDGFPPPCMSDPTQQISASTERSALAEFAGAFNDGDMLCQTIN
eukprot:8141991-Alexandrium_andersonii.AAC.1